MHLANNLRQMLDLLESERKALAGLDLERIINCAEGKHGICEELDGIGTSTLDEECLGLLSSVRRLNDINRQLRNMISANVQARLGALTGSIQMYNEAAGGNVSTLPR